MISNTTTLFFWANIAFNFTASNWLEKEGLRKVYGWCAVAMIAAVWIRYYALSRYTHDFHYCLIGQSILAVINIFYINGPSKLASLWFPQHEITIATSAASMSDPMGLIFGWVLPLFYFSNNAVEDKEKVLNLILEYNYQLTVITTVIGIFFILAFKDKPDFHPTAASRHLAEKQFDFWNELEELYQNKNYINLCICFSTIYGFYASFGVLVAQISPYYGIS